MAWIFLPVWHFWSERLGGWQFVGLEVDCGIAHFCQKSRRCSEVQSSMLPTGFKTGMWYMRWFQSYLALFTFWRSLKKVISLPCFHNGPSLQKNRTTIVNWISPQSVSTLLYPSLCLNDAETDYKPTQRANGLTEIVRPKLKYVCDK